MISRNLIRFGVALLGLACVGTASAEGSFEGRQWASSPLAAINPNHFKCTIVNTGYNDITLDIKIKNIVTGAVIASGIRTLDPMLGTTISGYPSYSGTRAYCMVTELVECFDGVMKEEKVLIDGLSFIGSRSSIRGNIQIDPPKSGFGGTTGALAELWPVAGQRGKRWLCDSEPLEP